MGMPPACEIFFTGKIAELKFNFGCHSFFAKSKKQPTTTQTNITHATWHIRRCFGSIWIFDDTRPRTPGAVSPFFFNTIRRWRAGFLPSPATHGRSETRHPDRSIGAPAPDKNGAMKSKIKVFKSVRIRGPALFLLCCFMLCVCICPAQSGGTLLALPLPLGPQLASK